MLTSMNRPRRQMLETGLACLWGAIFGSSAAPRVRSARAKSATPEKIRYSDLLLHELREKRDQRPLAYLPLGTLEQHGPHLPLGSDAIQSEELMLECARRFGGIVFPPIHVSPGPPKLNYDGQLPVRMDFWDITLDPATNVGGDTYWLPDVLYRSIIDGILAHCKRVGIRAVFADGHGPSRREWVRELKRREDHFGLKLFGIPKELLERYRSQTDHAGRNETSLMLHYRPDLVDLTRLPRSRSDWPRGVGGVDPRDGTAEYGKECMEAALELMLEMFNRHFS